MSNLYQQYGTSTRLELEGVWIKFEGGVELKMARASRKNTLYRETFERLMAPYRKRDGTFRSVSPEESDQIMAEVFATSVVRDWRNVTDRDGNPLDFSAANCKQVFLDLPDFFADVQSDASRKEMFQEQANEDDGKNSPASSAGT